MKEILNKKGESINDLMQIMDGGILIEAVDNLQGEKLKFPDKLLMSCDGFYPDLQQWSDSYKFGSPQNSIINSGYLIKMTDFVLFEGRLFCSGNVIWSNCQR